MIIPSCLLIKFHKNMIQSFLTYFTILSAIPKRWKDVIKQGDEEFSSSQYDDHLDKFLFFYVFIDFHGLQYSVQQISYKSGQSIINEKKSNNNI